MIVVIWEIYFCISGIALSPVSTNQQNADSYTWFKKKVTSSSVRIYSSVTFFSRLGTGENVQQ